MFRAPVEWTRGIRGSENRLFVSYQKPHKAVTKTTLAKWIKKILMGAGIDTTMFTLHSTRSASTNAAVLKISIDTVLRTAGWQRDCTFRRFYNFKVTNDSEFAHNILDDHRS